VERAAYLVHNSLGTRSAISGTASFSYSTSHANTCRNKTVRQTIATCEVVREKENIRY